jgi:hypothetical protein
MHIVWSEIARHELSDLCAGKDGRESTQGKTNISAQEHTNVEDVSRIIDV